MAFFLEERDTKFLTENQTPNIGPGHYHVPGAFKDRPSKSQDNKFSKGNQKQTVAFGQTTKRQGITNNSNFNPAPGYYTQHPMSFKQNYVSKQIGSEDDGSYYIIENGNLQKKTQLYAADRLQRFNNETNKGQNEKIGPGSYNLT